MKHGCNKIHHQPISDSLLGTGIPQVSYFPYFLYVNQTVYCFYVLYTVILSFFNVTKSNLSLTSVD